MWFEGVAASRGRAHPKANAHLGALCSPPLLQRETTIFSLKKVCKTRRRPPETTKPTLARLAKCLIYMVPEKGIEPSTFSLRMRWNIYLQPFGIVGFSYENQHLTKAIGVHQG
jgi:hypothetical protein